MMQKIIYIVILIVMTGLSGFGQSLVLEKNLDGEIQIHMGNISGLKTETSSDASGDSYARFSRIGTGLSVFTTSFVYASGYENLDLENGFMNLSYYKGNDDNRQLAFYPMNIMMLLGAFGASVCNYHFGFDSDLLAIMPVFPIVITHSNEGSFSYREAREYRLQYGIYFYFSRNI
jgi:hypothetical protein